MKSGEILIVGAGAAGLAAARQLIAAGCKVTVLEARNRLGGRICTLHDSWPAPLEAGPEFIHGDAEEMKRLLSLAGAKTEELPDEHWRFVSGAACKMDFQHVWGKILDRLRSYSGPDISFAASLEQCCGTMSPNDRTMA